MATRPQGMSREELLALPVCVEFQDAFRALGLGRTVAYQLARCGEFPVQLERIGGKYMVPKARLLRVLDETDESDEPVESDGRPAA
jgi:hypothetical protein